MQKKWIPEMARDLAAFGSIPFLFLTVARVSVMTPYYPMQFIISSLFFFLLNIKIKGNLRAGLGVILLGFTSLYYGSLLFAFFALLIYAGMIISLFYLKKEKRSIYKGIILGIISAGAGYYVVRLIFS